METKSIWTKICDVLKRYAIRDNEINYQKSIIDLLWEDKLGWNSNQIKEQLSIQLGSTERLVPDIIIAKDNKNKFIVEVKHPSHVKSSKDVAQLISYMKQLETPIGVYIGNEMEVYYKNIGDGSEPICVISLEFTPDSDKGADFVSLFLHSSFSIDNIINYIFKQVKKEQFEKQVSDLVTHILSSEFKEELKLIVATHLCDAGDEVVNAAMDAVTIDISPKRVKGQNATDNSMASNLKQDLLSEFKPRRVNRGVAQRYAYNLIRQIITKNPSLKFRQLRNIFVYKNYIEDIVEVKDMSRWCMDKSDIIQLSDGTHVVVSNQWGFNGACKKKMDKLIEIAHSFGIYDPKPC